MNKKYSYHKKEAKKAEEALKEKFDINFDEKKREEIFKFVDQLTDHLSKSIENFIKSTTNIDNPLDVVTSFSFLMSTLTSSVIRDYYHGMKCFLPPSLLLKHVLNTLDGIEENIIDYHGLNKDSDE